MERTDMCSECKTRPACPDYEFPTNDKDTDIHYVSFCEDCYQEFLERLMG